MGLLLLIKFTYNNTKYNIIEISPFYIYYRFYPYLKYKIKVDNSSSILTALERIKRIFFKYKVLVKH